MTVPLQFMAGNAWPITVNIPWTLLAIEIGQVIY